MRTVSNPELVYEVRCEEDIQNARDELDTKNDGSYRPAGTTV